METIIDNNTKREYQISPTKFNGENDLQCPICSSNRKKSSAKPLRYNAEKGVGTCHHCGAVFSKKIGDSVPKKKQVQNYNRPEWKNKTDLPEGIVKYFESRSISQQTIKTANLVSYGAMWSVKAKQNVGAIEFNFFRDNDLILVKSRSRDKDFKLTAGAELIFYNLDAIKNHDTVIITEGEIDCLSFIEAGITNVISVPNGATPNPQKAKMEFMANCEAELSRITKFILAMDMDAVGIAFRDELARRLGKEKCATVDFKDCKDANEYLLKYGKVALAEVVETATDYPIEGIITVNQIKDDFTRLWKNGLQEGLKIGDPMDEFVTYEKGRLYTVTGIPSHGKSEYLDFVVSKLVLRHSMTAAYFTPENHPTELHLAKIAAKFIGTNLSPANFDPKMVDAMSDFLSESYYWVDPADYTIDSILESARGLVFRHGLDILVIDPYNKLEHKRAPGQTETEYVSLLLDKILRFCRHYNVLVFLVAHPTKLPTIKTTDGTRNIISVPTMYDISGSANFFNKTDFGICVYRDKVDEVVTVYCQKAKFRHLGKDGSVRYKFNLNNGRYSPIEDINATGTEVFWDDDNYLDTGITEPESASIENNDDALKTEPEPEFSFDIEAKRVTNFDREKGLDVPF